jgi:undecaprenyl diphosphate synthase
MNLIASDDPTLRRLGPSHVAIIMDGNGRWAKARGLPRFMGHRAGVDAVWRTIDAALELGLSHLTLFGFSSENWQRSPLEVSGLMHLLRTSLRHHVVALHRKGVRIRCIGDRSMLAPDIQQMIADGERLEPARVALTLTVAWNYGGRGEIVEAARTLARRVQAGEIDPEEIDADGFADCLQTAGIPDPDMVIRTSGELRLSNFLLWQSAYAELLFIDTFWPDFGRSDLEAAIREYWRRDRRFGAITAKAAV